MGPGGDEGCAPRGDGNGQDPARRRRSVRLPVLLVLVLLAGCAAPPPPPPPDGPERLDAWPAWEVGDTWSWLVRSRDSDYRYVEGNVSGVVVAVEPDVYVVRTRDNTGTETDARFWRGNLTVVGSSGETFRLPLVEGANWTSNGLRYRVLGVEHVETRAGRFEAWHIEGKGNVASRDDWWAPEAKVWVKSRQVRSVGGGDVAIERELQTFALTSGER